MAKQFVRIGIQLPYDHEHDYPLFSKLRNITMILQRLSNLKLFYLILMWFRLTTELEYNNFIIQVNSNKTDAMILL
jgi:hypothetical protein